MTPCQVQSRYCPRLLVAGGYFGSIGSTYEVQFLCLNGGFVMSNYNEIYNQLYFCMYSLDCRINLCEISWLKKGQILANNCISKKSIETQNNFFLCVYVCICLFLNLGVKENKIPFTRIREPFKIRERAFSFYP